MGSLKHAPGHPCCIEGSGTGTGSGSGDPFVENCCARSLASDWDGNALSALAITFGHTGSFVGAPFAPIGSAGCLCALMESTFVVPYDTSLLDRSGAGGTTICHAWEEVFILPCEDPAWRVSMHVVATVVSTGSQCRLHICRTGWVENAAGAPVLSGSTGAFSVYTFSVSPTAGTPVDLTASVPVALVSSGAFCPTSHPHQNGSRTPILTGQFQYCRQNYLPTASAILT